MKCKICKINEATIIDRDEYPFSKKRTICIDCQTKRLKEDLKIIMRRNKI